MSFDEINSLEIFPALEVPAPAVQGSPAWGFPSFKPLEVPPQPHGTGGGCSGSPDQELGRMRGRGGGARGSSSPCPSPSPGALVQGGHTIAMTLGLFLLTLTLSLYLLLCL